MISGIKKTINKNAMFSSTSDILVSYLFPYTLLVKEKKTTKIISENQPKQWTQLRG